MLAGCSDEPQKYDDTAIDKNITIKSDVEQALADRFLEYHHLRSIQAFEQSYLIELPAYRFISDYKLYLAESRTVSKDFNTTLLSISYNPQEKDIAYAHYRYKKQNHVTLHQERWMYVNEKWYHSYDFSPFPD